MIARPVLDRDVGQFGIAAILRNRDITLPLVMDLSVLRLLLLTITGVGSITGKGSRSPPT